MKKPTKAILGSMVLFLVACTNHLQIGIDAYSRKNYAIAVKELEQVSKRNKNYPRAQLVLAKAKFRLALATFVATEDAAEAVRQLPALIKLADEAGASDTLKDLTEEMMVKLKQSTDPAVIKPILLALLDIFNNNRDMSQIQDLVRVLVSRTRDFLFSPEMRSLFRDAIKQLDSLN